MSQERTIWSGSPSQYLNLKVFILCIVAAALWVFAGIAYFGDRTNIEIEGAEESVADPISPTFFLLMLAGFLVPLLIALWHAWKVRSTHYSLTNQRIITQYGMLTRRTDELELYRIRDYRIEQPFFQRICGLGSIVLETSDRTHPTLVLTAIPHPEVLRDHIREHVEQRRAAGGVREVDIA